MLGIGRAAQGPGEPRVKPRGKETEAMPPGDPTLDPDAFEGAVFDLDGVVTRTAAVHAAAWKDLFDPFLQDLAGRTCQPFRPFDIEEDYRRYVDGKPRYEGVKSFLAARGIDLPYGSPDDPPGTDTICGLGNRKDALFNELLRRDGVQVFEDAESFVRTLRARGLKIGLVTSSKNAAAVLDAAGIADLFDVRVDGVEAARLGLKGKPSPDTFLRAAELMGVPPARAFAVEDATVGVEAEKAAGFRLVIGVDRDGMSDALRAHGADVVVRDFGEFLIKSGPEGVERS
jgi:beta-phosphoglucomutase family hydrolase